jgi:hypothetical protein
MRITLILVVALVTVVCGNNNNRNNNNDNNNNNNNNNNHRKGDCFCVNEDSVEIRTSACGNKIFGKANSGDCFKYTGHSTGCKSDGWWFQFFQIDYKGKKGWVSIDYLNNESRSRCGGKSSRGLDEEGDVEDTRSFDDVAAANEFQ